MKHKFITLEERRNKQVKPKYPFPHQREAFKKMDSFFEDMSKVNAGLLFLPTGGGKTYTAVDWICRKILAENIKVLWLAHTFHLLDQAATTFDEMAYQIPAVRDILNIRTISSHKSHSKVYEIKPKDDVLLMTTATAINHFMSKDQDQSGQPIQSKFREFLKTYNKTPFFIVLDEAHHSPAYGCRNLLLGFKKLLKKHQLLGLTATPTYTNESRRGWLKKLFEGGVIYKANNEDLIQQKILAKPQYTPIKTKIPLELDEKQYQRLVREHKDMPEEIIEQLSKHQKRNDFIIDHYLRNRKKYGKTLIFADRSFQCEYLKKKLGEKVKVGAIYSHIDKSPASAEERNRQSTDANKKAIEAFKENKLDVLINIKMLTEGTDVPNIRTVFITRETTSQILFTQMVGRALRGEKAGGEKTEANIVMFTDDWKQHVRWIHPDLDGGIENGRNSSYQSAIKYISIQLLRDLVQQMDSDYVSQGRPYLEIIPLGWYVTTYEVRVDNESEECLSAKHNIMIYNQTERKFKDVIADAKKNLDEQWEKEDLSQEWMEKHVRSYLDKYFNLEEDNFGNSLLDDIIHILRHIAQSPEEDTTPPCILFEKRDQYDLDKLVEELKHLPQSELRRQLQQRYRQEDMSLWREWYPDFYRFKTAFDVAMNYHFTSIEKNDETFGQSSNANQTNSKKSVKEIENPRELSDKEKKQVKIRDKKRCLCCHSEQSLQVDHIRAFKHSGNTSIDNSQTLCSYCNKKKANDTIDFRIKRSKLSKRPEDWQFIEPCPKDLDAYYEKDYINISLRRNINFFYRAKAFHKMDFHLRKTSSNGKTKNYKKWVIHLSHGNNPKWLLKYKKELLSFIEEKLKQSQVKRIKVQELFIELLILR